jgi:hypothetical protein
MSQGERRAAEQLAQLRLGALEYAAAFGREPASRTVDVEIEHRDR